MCRPSVGTREHDPHVEAVLSVNRAREDHFNAKGAIVAGTREMRDIGRT